MEQEFNLETLAKVAEVELIYKAKVKISGRPVVKKAADAYRLFMLVWDMDKIELAEQFKVIFLNAACRAMGICDISSGGRAGTIVDPKMVFAAALKAGAMFLIAARNHPSGELKPSRQDTETTRRLADCGKLLHLPVIEHLIITSEGFFSFAESGLL